MWGLTTHPKNSKLTPGGSSGGEAALISLQGSLVGWGTDIGGSIRIPSHMNGLWGFKPSVSVALRSGHCDFYPNHCSKEWQVIIPRRGSLYRWPATRAVDCGSNGKIPRIHHHHHKGNHQSKSLELGCTASTDSLGTTSSRGFLQEATGNRCDVG